MEKGNGRWSSVVRIWDTVSPSLICTMPSKPNILVTNAPTKITIKEICNSKTPYLRWLHRRAAGSNTEIENQKKLQKIEKRIVIDYFPCHRRPLRLLDKSCGSQQDHISTSNINVIFHEVNIAFKGELTFFMRGYILSIVL